jgi:hypothetical protein
MIDQEAVKRKIKELNTLQKKDQPRFVTAQNEKQSSYSTINLINGKYDQQKVQLSNRKNEWRKIIQDLQQNPQKMMKMVPSPREGKRSGTSQQA